MANEEHVERLRAGVEGWNRWRLENPGVRPGLGGADLSGADLTGAFLIGAFLSETNLSGAFLSGADLIGADLIGANLSRANLSRANLSRTDLSQTTLTGAKLSEAKFSRANLTGAFLSRAFLSRADLTGANLSETNLRRADLSGADLTGANLEGADLTGANLSRVNLDNADLSGTNLEGADLWRTIFADIDLRGVPNLYAVRHRGPSIIGINTLYKSGGQIPEVFLRGCGVPDSMIEYARALVAAERPIDYYSVFISYSSHDDALAERLHADLQARGVRCWFAPHDMQIGDSIVDRIDQAIRLHEKLLLILSESSVASRWVEAETKTAIMRERNEGRAVLFPIRLDDAVMQSAAGWAAQLHERHIGDFRQWKDHDAYQAAFARLLRDLQATPATP